MILETLLGGLGGGILRLAPEVMKIMDAKNERAHELAMTNLSIEADKAKAQDARALVQLQGEQTFNASALQTLTESIKAQATVTGIKFIDGLSSLVRPSITFAFFGLYAACRIAAFILATKHGTPALNVLGATWTGEDQAMLFGILNFWFVGRVMDKALR